MKATECHKKVIDNYNMWQHIEGTEIGISLVEIEVWFFGLLCNLT